MQDFFADELEALRARSLDRHLREITSAQGPELLIAGRHFINFSSNDCLGLANHPRLRDAATAAIDEFGVGAGASRLISGTQSPHLRLERGPLVEKGLDPAAVCAQAAGASGGRGERGWRDPLVGRFDWQTTCAVRPQLAKWKGTEAALCFSSGYAAALGTIPALVTKNDVILLDKLCHASLIDGAKLSGAVLRVFPHNHMGKLESHLEWARREHPERAFSS